MIFSTIVWGWDFRSIPFTFLEEHTAVNAYFRDRASLLVTQRDGLFQLFVRPLSSVLIFTALFVKSSTKSEKTTCFFVRFLFVGRSIVFLGGEGFFYDSLGFILSLALSERFIFLKRTLKVRQRI